MLGEVSFCKRTLPNRQRNEAKELQSYHYIYYYVQLLQYYSMHINNSILYFSFQFTCINTPCYSAQCCSYLSTTLLLGCSAGIHQTKQGRGAFCLKKMGEGTYLICLCMHMINMGWTVLANAKTTRSYFLGPTFISIIMLLWDL